MGKIKDFFLKIVNALPFGLQGAEREIMGSNNTGDGGTVITQEVSDERVAKHLLKGEVTQEVEELRYRTYKVANESEKYKYVGNGVAFKNEDDTKKSDVRTKYNVTQENKIICSSILKELQHVDNYGTEEYRVEIMYNDVVRFKLERYAHTINVKIDETKNIIETTLRFWKNRDKYDATSGAFLNALKEAIEIKNEYAISRNEILSSIESISFSTYKASGDEDFVTYAFTEGCKYLEGFETKDEYILTFSWDSYIRVPLKPEEKYYSKTMDEKYRTNARKKVNVELMPLEKKYFCSVCGKEVDEYTASIQMADGQKPICNECAKKALKRRK